ncbi:glycogenin-1-like isoform X2 [Salvelinus fontinalis]|uniref:glycogenin-1-like isoform X2 n=1 Tax=Salvelinus fontinalis TaxID=8038 RepID=UPI00248588D9|nr:glycogenin-1-like isoform X2 [Salvelinus fontinalis]
MSKDQAFVTLATNDNYARGAMVLGKSLRNHQTTRQLVVMIGPKVSDPCKGVLHKIFDEVLLVEVLDSRDAAHLTLMKRPDLGVTFTKLRCWTLTHYSKCVFMDADTLVVQNIDELFDREELSASPDPGWPDCFNSGVFVFRPSDETYGKLLQYCTEHGSFDGGDQGILNGYFSDWATADISKHLPFIYNLSSIAIYTYLPAFKQYGGNAKVVHFLGQTKPWSYTYDPTTKKISGDMQETSTHLSFLLDWWFLYSSSVVPMMAEGYGDQPFHSGCVEFQSSVKESCNHDGHWPALWSQICSPKEDGWKGSSTSHEPHHTEPYMPPETSEERKQKWEQGQADYMGIDSFDNIQKKLDAFLK